MNEEENKPTKDYIDYNSLELFELAKQGDEQAFEYNYVHHIKNN